MQQKIRPIETIDPEQPARPQPFDERAPYEEDEINLIDYLIVLLRHKFLIIGMIFVAGIGAVVHQIINSSVIEASKAFQPGF